MREGQTECSSCFTSSTVPSLKVHFTTSVSGETPFINSLLLSADQNSLKFSSLIKCQTEPKGAAITADSVTDVEVGIREAMLINVWILEVLMGFGIFGISFEGERCGML